MAKPSSPQALGGGSRHLSICPLERSQLWGSRPAADREPGTGSHALRAPWAPLSWLPSPSGTSGNLASCLPHLRWVLKISTHFLVLGLQPLTWGDPAPLSRARTPSQVWRRLTKSAGSDGTWPELEVTLLCTSCVTSGKCINLSVS